MFRFGEAKKDGFETFLGLPNCIRSHDRFSDVFAKLAPEFFQKGFVSYASSTANELVLGFRPLRISAMAERKSGAAGYREI
ncbi:MAG: hypothetical protein CMI13_09605 [Oleibacter sp.]|nr:hypothetical protein [Thalassolituus sp.]